MSGANLKTWLVMAVFLSGMVGTSFGGKIIYVDANAVGNNGSSWADAYKFLQDGLADAKSSAKPVEIRVAQGIYKPDEDTLHPNGTGDRTAAFQLINGVTLKGGYAGPRMSLSGADPNSRDIKEYETILSGDIGIPSDKSDNCFHVFYHPEGLNLDDTAILDGFTITGGNADDDSWPDDCGGGMFNQYHNSPTVKDCTFTENSAYAGGGMYNDYSSSPTVEGCTFSENSATYGGGGMYNYKSSPTVA
ncbi:MAG: right-handed parallel beta-helix repeat-containing protein, partial [Planctomycetota bacterium]|nr:right-handed parallel beta-helix repeat-containing protein [Planctomycetota bacterium]